MLSPKDTAPSRPLSTSSVSDWGLSSPDSLIGRHVKTSAFHEELRSASPAIVRPAGVTFCQALNA